MLVFKHLLTVNKPPIYMYKHINYPENKKSKCIHFQIWVDAMRQQKYDSLDITCCITWYCIVRVLLSLHLLTGALFRRSKYWGANVWECRDSGISKSNIRSLKARVSNVFSGFASYALAYNRLLYIQNLIGIILQWKEVIYRMYCICFFVLGKW